MKLSALDYGLWAATFLGDATLFLILIVRRRWRDFPVFTTYIGFEATMTVAMYLVLFHFPSWYARIYWPYVGFMVFFELAVVWEVARIVMRPTGTWVRDAKRQFLFWGASGVVIAAALPWLVKPPASNPLEILEVRAGLFASFVICELYYVLIRTSKSLGLGWRNHVMAVGNGWTVWAVMAILVEGLHSYFGAWHYFVYIAAVGYWIVQFWLEEPVRQPISPELQAYILDLHRRVKNNLDTLDAQR